MLGPKNGGERGAIGWSTTGIRAEESRVQRPRDSVAPEQCLEQGEQLGQGALGQGRVRAGDPAGWLLAFLGA